MAMEVSKKTFACVIALALVFIILATFYIMNNPNTIQSTEEDQPQNNPPESPEEPQLVVPESPIGTLGLISALAAGFGIFTIMKKRR